MQFEKLAPLFSDRACVSPMLGSALSLLVRGVFASVLLPFFVTSFLTKIDDFGLSVGAYVQILPKLMERVGYNPAALAWPLHLLVLAGTLAELALPLMVVLGLATRAAALAMIGFVVVMSLTDIFGHGLDAATIGAMFDRDPYGLIMDQRLLWGTLLAVLAVVGGGAVSLDAALRRWAFGQRK